MRVKLNSCRLLAHLRPVVVVVAIVLVSILPGVVEMPVGAV
jgi:hypothetical protein